MKKTLAVLLALTMALTMLPAAALAAEPAATATLTAPDVSGSNGEGSASVTITSSLGSAETPEGEIRYTTDSTDPTPTTGEVVSDAHSKVLTFTGEGSHIVKAIVVKTTGEVIDYSPVAEKTVTVTATPAPEPETAPEQETAPTAAASATLAAPTVVADATAGTVTITNELGSGKIRYTTDGTEPSATTGTEVSELSKVVTFAAAGDYTVKALVTQTVESTINYSPIASATITVAEESVETPPIVLGAPPTAGVVAGSATTVAEGGGTVYMGETLVLTAYNFQPSDWEKAYVRWRIKDTAAGYATLDTSGVVTVNNGGTGNESTECILTPVVAGKTFNVYCDLMSSAADGATILKTYTIPVTTNSNTLTSISVAAGTSTYAAGNEFNYDNSLRINATFGSGSTATVKRYKKGTAGDNMWWELLDKNKNVLSVSDLGSEVKMVRIWLRVGSISKSVLMNVTVNDPKILSGVTVKDGTTVVSGGSVVVGIDDTTSKKLTAEAQMAGQVDETNITTTWNSSNTAVAEVSGDGTITPKTIGSTTITCTMVQVYTQAGHASITTRQTATTTVYINGVSVKEIKLKAPTRDTYRVGETFDKTGAEAVITYGDNTTVTVPASRMRASKTTAFDTAGTAKIDLYYGDIKLTDTGKLNPDTTYNVTGQIEVEVIGATQVLTDLTVATPPTKVDYAKGETFDVTGATLTATFSDGTDTRTATVNPTSYSPKTALNELGTVTITLSYTAGSVTKTATTTVKVYDAHLSAITAKLKAGAQTVYHVGQSLRKADVEIEATYQTADGTPVPALTKTISGSESGVTVAPATFTTSHVGSVEVTIKYTTGGYTKTTSLLASDDSPNPITVDATKVTSLRIKTDPSKTVYKAGETLDTTGLTAEATFASGETSLISASQMSYSPRTFSTEGVKAVTATYTCNGTSVKATFYVTVSGTSPTPVGQTGTIVNCKSWVNVRSGPSTAYSKIGTAAKGANYEVLDVSGNWYKVQYTASKVGWIYKSYVSLSGSGEVVEYNGTATIVNCTSWVNVRSGPSTAYAKLGTAAKGSQYTITGYVTSSAGNRWWQVVYGGATAYIYGQYVSTSGGSTGSTGYGYIYNCTSWVNVRSGAGTNYSKLGTAAKYNVYEVLGVSGNWYKIQYTGTKVGYVSKTYFNHVTGNTSNRATITANCTVRAGAATSSSALGTATQNESYTYLTTAGSWYMIVFGSRIGYIPSSSATVS